MGRLNHGIIAGTLIYTAGIVGSHVPTAGAWMPVFWLAATALSTAGLLMILCLPGDQ